MPISFPGIPTPIIGLVFVLVISIYLGFEAASSNQWESIRYGRPQRSVKAFAQTFATALVILLIVLNVITSFGSTMSLGFARTGSTLQAAHEFGLDSGKAYPLQIGTVTGGTAGSITSSGFFSARTTVDLRPATAITLSFDHDNSSWILTIPTDNVTFHQQNGATATMAIYLRNDYWSDLWDQRQGPCHWGISNLAIGCVRYYVNPHLQLAPETKQRGLAPIVNGNVDHVDITLPPALYREVMDLHS